MTKKEQKKVGFKFTDEVIKLVTKDPQKFAQDYFFVQHIQKIYKQYETTADFDELRIFMENYKTKIPKQFLDREGDKTVFSDTPSLLSNFEQKPNAIKQGQNKAPSSQQQKSRQTPNKNDQITQKCKKMPLVDPPEIDIQQHSSDNVVEQKDESTQTDKVNQLLEHKSNSSFNYDHEVVAMPTQTRNQINIAQPLFNMSQHYIERSKFQEGYVNVMRGNVKIQLKSKILQGKQE